MGRHIQSRLSLTPQSFSGSPTSGDYLQGDIIVDSAAIIWECIVSGNPGTWTQVLTASSSASVLTGKTVWVDAVNGNDSTGTRGVFNKPFLTVNAALAASGLTSGDLVFIRPGTYNLAAGITIPTGVSIRGASRESVTIQMLAVVANTTLVTMGLSSSLEDVSLILTSLFHHTLTGCLFAGTTSSSARLRWVKIFLGNQSAGAGTSEVTGILVQSTGTPDYHTLAMRSCTVDVLSAGSGKKRGLLMNTSIGQFRVRESVFSCDIVGTDSKAAEIDIVGGTLTIHSSTLKGATVDVSQTAGSLELGVTDLRNSNANGKYFLSLIGSTSLIWGVEGAISTLVRYAVPGSGVPSLPEVKFRIPRTCVIKGLAVRVVAAPGGVVVDTYTLRKNGVDTLLVTTLTGAAVGNVNVTDSVTFLAGDDISLKTQAGSLSASTDAYINVEIY